MKLSVSLALTIFNIQRFVLNVQGTTFSHFIYRNIPLGILIRKTDFSSEMSDFSLYYSRSQYNNYEYTNSKNRVDDWDWQIFNPKEKNKTPLKTKIINSFQKNESFYLKIIGFADYGALLHRNYDKNQNYPNPKTYGVNLSAQKAGGSGVLASGFILKAIINMLFNQKT